MNKKDQVFIFVGRSGSGKGTQSHLLKKYFLEKNKETNIKEIIMGDIFRSFFEEDGFIQKISREKSLVRGEFQPDFLTNALFVNEVIKMKENDCLFFDGFPRSTEQLKVVKDFLSYIKKDKPTVINIDVSRESVEERMLLRNRADDKKEAIEKRLNEFDCLTQPMIDEIKRDSFFKYLEINGEETIEEIHYNLIKKINI